MTPQRGVCGTSPTDSGSDRRRRAHRHAGFALIEFLIMVPVVIVGICGIFQIYVAHQAVFNTMGSVDQLLLQRALDRNCPDRPKCQYSTDPEAEGLGGVSTAVAWRPRVPVLRIFAESGPATPPEIGDTRELCAAEPCRRTRIGAGTYMTWYQGLGFALRARSLDADQMAGIGAAAAAGVFDRRVDVGAAAAASKVVGDVLRRFGL